MSMSSVTSVVAFFFFSSRRRHTRFDCDWSSDVCSSDLGGALRQRERRPRRLRGGDVRGPVGLQRLAVPAHGGGRGPGSATQPATRHHRRVDRERGGEGKRGELGGRRYIKKKKK